MALNQLAALGEVRVKQKATRFFAGNKYVVLTMAGEELLTAKESVMLGTPNRRFKMSVCDSQGREVIRMKQPVGLGGAKLEVKVRGELACVVRQKLCMSFVLHIQDASGQTRYRIRNASAWAFGNGPIDYHLQTADKRNIGLVRKENSGFWREAFTHLDNYTLSFPVNMDVRFKAGVIGACILIDFIKYEAVAD